MKNPIMIGCDLHDAWMVMRLSVNGGRSFSKSWKTSDVDGLLEFLSSLAKEHDSDRTVFVYEASGQGFGLYDRLTEVGIECYVLAPTHLPRSVHRLRNKTDDKDAEMLLDEVRGFVMARRSLPSVWVPDPQTRCDRELVRRRLEQGEQRTRIKNQIRGLLKRYQCEFPEWFTKSGEWSKKSVAWLRGLAGPATGMDNESVAESPVKLDEWVQVSLATLIELYETMTRQLKKLDETILRLASTNRYWKSFRKLMTLKGVGQLTAMTFLTELGDLNRFPNRRCLAAYLGLAPSAFESGQQDDRKGHITRQGPARVRHVLCQAAWATQRCSPEWKAKYERIKRGTSKRSKVAIVAIMRQLAITMWHVARSSELDEQLEAFDTIKKKRRNTVKQTEPTKKASARARQKGAAPPPVAVTST
jgi:transposase